MRNLIPVLLLLISLIIPSCASLPNSPATQSQKINTGYGPEDIVIDPSTSTSTSASTSLPHSHSHSDSNTPSLLISASSRRDNYPSFGEIERYYQGDTATNRLIRLNEPDTLVFRPHGISITATGEANFLYVISHDDKNGHHPVLKYKIEGEELILKETFSHPILVSPNALHAFSNGSFLVCNDAMKRNSMLDKIFRLKRSNIIYYDGNGNWTEVADKMGMVAGLNYKEGKVYASAALENKVYVFDFIEGELQNKKLLAKIEGPDNIRFYNDDLLVTSHFKPIKFILHVSNANKKSPSLVYSVNLETGEKEVLYSNPGEKISAASAALILSGKLYISQIFEPWILEVDLPEQ
jgi:hypothetical protein